MLSTIQVLLSSYNGEKYVAQQIESILAQKNVDVHLLIRDDGSKDHTLEVMSKYQDKNIKIIRGENCGSTKSFFTLMQLAGNFDYYAFADQDDIWDHDKLFVAIEKIKNYQKPAVYASNTRIVDSNSNFISCVKRTPKINLGSAMIKNYAAGCTQVFNKLLMVETKKFPPPNVPYHDWWINILCLSLGGVSIYDPIPHMSYRQHGENVVGSNDSFFPKWSKRLNKFLHGSYHRSLIAAQILEMYAESLSDQEKNLLKMISDCEKHPWKILISNQFHTGNRVDDFFFYICVLCKKA